MAGNLHRMIDVVGLRTRLAKTSLDQIDELIEVGNATSAAREKRFNLS
jgi:hypothetical protein